MQQQKCITCDQMKSDPTAYSKYAGLVASRICVEEVNEQSLFDYVPEWVQEVLFWFSIVIVSSIVLAGICLCVAAIPLLIYTKKGADVIRKEWHTEEFASVQQLPKGELYTGKGVPKTASSQGNQCKQFINGKEIRRPLPDGKVTTAERKTQQDFGGLQSSDKVLNEDDL